MNRTIKTIFFNWKDMDVRAVVSVDATGNKPKIKEACFVGCNQAVEIEGELLSIIRPTIEEIIKGR